MGLSRVNGRVVQHNDAGEALSTSAT